MRIAAESIIIITYFYEYLHFQFAHKNPCSKSFHPSIFWQVFRGQGQHKEISKLFKQLNPNNNNNNEATSESNILYENKACEPNVSVARFTLWGFLFAVSIISFSAAVHWDLTMEELPLVTVTQHWWINVSIISVSSADLFLNLVEICTIFGWKSRQPK